MDLFSRKCIVAVLGSAAYIQYSEAVAEQYEIRHEQRLARGGLLEQYGREWRALRPDAELAAQFFFTDPGLAAAKPKRGRRVTPNRQQLQFFEDKFFSTVDFFRRVGEDIAADRVSASATYSYLGTDARRWLPQLVLQRDKWDDARNYQLDQAITALNAIIAAAQKADVAVRHNSVI